LATKVLGKTSFLELAHGEPLVEIGKAIDRIVDDVFDRGMGEKKPKERKVLIEIVLVPGGEDLPGYVTAFVNVDGKIPKTVTHGTLLKQAIGNGGQQQLLWQEDSPENPDQPTLPFVEKARAKAAGGEE
jgi:hypothetical protein